MRYMTGRKQDVYKRQVQFHFGVQVTNVEFDCTADRKVAKRIDVLRDGKSEAIDLTENDLVFITNGGCVENSSMGSQNTQMCIRDRSSLTEQSPDSERAAPAENSVGAALSLTVVLERLLSLQNYFLRR